MVCATVGFGLLLFACYVMAFNFYVSVLHAPLSRRRNPEQPIRYVSNVPLIGSMLTLFGIFAIAGSGYRPPFDIIAIAFIMQILDTGSVLWMLVILISMPFWLPRERRAERKHRARE